MPVEITDFVDSTHEILKNANSSGRTGLSEAATCESIIAPFLTTLGWEEIDKQRPFKVKMGSQTKEVDYALFIGGADEPQVFIEAKPEKNSLIGDHLEQLRSYMRQEWVEWGLLTNGRHYQLVRLVPSTEGSPNLRILIDVGLDGLSTSFLPDILNKGAMESGEANELGDDLQGRMDTIQVLKGDPGLVGEAVDNATLTGDVPHDGESVISELNQRLVIEAKASQTPEPGPDFPTVHRQEITGEDDARVVWMSSRPGGVDFLREHHAWAFVGYPRRDPKYLALYISSPVQEVKYVARIDRVVPAREFGGIDDTLKQQNDGKYVLDLSEIKELDDPIPFGRGEANVLGMTYTTMGRLKEANTVDDL